MARSTRKRDVYDLNKIFQAVNDAGTQFLYTKEASDALVLWTRMNSGSPVNLANTGITVSYEGSPSTSEFGLDTGDRLYPAVTFNDVSNLSAATSNSSDLSFSSVSSGASPTASSDLPFSLSFWFNVDNLSGIQYLLGKASAAPTSQDREYGAYIVSEAHGSNLYFKLEDEANGNQAQAIRTTSAISPGRWYHAVLTYDGRGTATAYQGLKIYLDGSLVSTTIASAGSSYVGMAPNHSQPLYIGGAQTSLSEFDGQMGEFCAWKNHELSADEVQAIYRITRTYRPFKSGISSLPPKAQILEKQIIGNSPPLNLRNGDHDALRSMSSLPFDDTNSVTFGTNFPEAVITFNDKIKPGDFIDLTGSLGRVKERFRFIEKEGFPGAVFDGPSDILIPLNTTKLTGDGISGLGTVNIKLDSPRAAANQFVKRVNSSNIPVSVKYLPRVLEKYDNEGNVLETPLISHSVVLRHRTPSTGSNSQGNIIKVGSLHPILGVEKSSENMTVRQFKQSLAAPVRLGTLEALDGNSPSIVHGGHSEPTLFASASIVKGISDANYDEIKNYVISPFDESRVLVEDDDFDNTGTPSTIIEGFTSPAKSKTQIVINCKSSDSLGDAVYHSTGSGASGPQGTFHASIQGTPGSGFAYWNKNLSKWEMKDWYNNDARTNGGVFASNPTHRFGAPVGFTLLPSSSWSESDSNKFARFKNDRNLSNRSHNDKMSRLLGGVSQPTDAFGFPLAEQYNATSSQSIHLGDHIVNPFLLEKIKVEVKGVFGVGTTSYFKNYDLPVTKTFFLLNQRTNGDNPHVVQDYESEDTSYGASHPDHWETSNQFYANRILGNREIIAWGSIGFVRHDNRIVTGSLVNFDTLNSNYDVIKRVSENASTPAVSSSFVLKIEPRLALKNSHLSIIPNLGSSGVYGATDLSNNRGGSDMLGGISGRQIASSIGASQNSELTSSFLKFDDHTNTSQKQIRAKEEYYKVSPYLLMPKDRLIIGWQNITTLEEDGVLDDGTSVSGRSEQVIADQFVDRLQEVKITLFGSSIRSEEEFNDTLNQNLSSGPIQEVIFGSPVLDQFEVEPEIALSGSTFDALFFGSMTGSGEGIRGRRASIAKGEAGSTGSLTKNYGLSSPSVKYFDSLPAPIEEYLSDPTFFSGPGIDPASTVTVGGVSRTSIVLSNNLADSSSKFLRKIGDYGSPSYKSKIRKSPASNYLVPPGGGPVTIADTLVFNTSPVATAYKIFSGSKEDVFGVKSYGSPEIAKLPKPSPPKFLESKKIKFLISSIFHAAPIIKLGSDHLSFPVSPIPGAAGVVPEIRGAKYGMISPTPRSPKNYFRRSSFGQFRDLIEQEPETHIDGVLVPRFLEGSDELVPGQAAVKARFFSRNGTPDIDPLDTNCQNLSQFATSSFPYYDGLSIERDVITDPPPDLTDKTGIEEAVLAFTDGDA